MLFFNFNFSRNPSLLYFIKITVVDLKTKGKQKNKKCFFTMNSLRVVGLDLR